MQPAFPLSATTSAVEPLIGSSSVQRSSLSVQHATTTTDELDLTSPSILPDTAAIQLSPDQESKFSEKQEDFSTPDQGERAVVVNARGEATATSKVGEESDRTLKRGRSFWNLFRPNSRDAKEEEMHGLAMNEDEVKGKEAAGAESEEIVVASSAGPSEKVEASSSTVETADDVSHKDKQDVASRRRSSTSAGGILNFSSLVMPWNASGRRSSGASVTSTTSSASVGASSSTSATTTTVDDDGDGDDEENKRDPLFATAAISARGARLPSRSATLDVHAAVLRSGRRLADDHLRFAHARHLIKVTQSVHVLRQLAIDLEHAFRQQLDKLAFLHAQYEALTWQLTDLRDENAQLRKQLGTLSEQIVEQQMQMQIQMQTEEAAVLPSASSLAPLYQAAASASALSTSAGVSPLTLPPAAMGECNDDGDLATLSASTQILFSSEALSPVVVSKVDEEEGGHARQSRLPTIAL